MPNTPVLAAATGLPKTGGTKMEPPVSQPPKRRRQARPLLRLSLPIPPGAGPRAVLEAQIERLIDLLDRIAPDADLEASADLEPWLAGAPSPGISGLDCELDESEDEFSLGSLDSAIDQTRWADGPQGDYEGPDSDSEEIMWSNPLGAVVDGQCRLIIETVPDRQVHQDRICGSSSDTCNNYKCGQATSADEARP